MKKNGNYIAGRWVAAASGRTLVDFNPADTRDILARVPRSAAEDVDAAVRAAQDAYPAWAETPAPKRARFLFETARILERDKKTLASLMTREMGKALSESLADVQEAIDTAFFFAGEGRRLYGQTAPSELRDKICMTFRRPVGVCGLITPWNFPLAIPSWKVYPALICGNTVVLKPAEDTPLLALRLAAVFEEAGLPAGVLNVVTGLGEEAGEALVNHPGVSLISFTGSSEVGAHVASLCGRQLKRVSLELGGKNAQIVLEDADLELAAEAALWGAFATSGQRCTATSRLLVAAPVYERFLKRFLKAAKSFKVGPVVSAAQLERIHRYVEEAKSQGARLVAGGRRLTGGAKKHGFFYEPTVFADVEPGMTIAQEEVFGPVVAFIKVRDYAEAIRVANGTNFGLSSSVFTRDVSRAIRSLSDIQSGITYVNSSTIGAEAHLPFGGTKKTGNGHREAGVTALDIFSEWKTVYIDTSGRLQKAQSD